MKKCSTQNLDLLPAPSLLKRICQSLAALEAIICPEWSYRYYSYNKDWGKEEECCQMRDGSGDEMLILFQKEGVVINGFAHEHKRNHKDVMTSNLPQEFHEFIFGEPIKSIGTTFCIWGHYNTNKWMVNPVADVVKGDIDDGSEELLELLDGRAATYCEWATEYYELEQLNLDAIQKVFNHASITPEMIHVLNPELDDIQQLKADLSEIGFPYQL